MIDIDFTEVLTGIKKGLAPANEALNDDLVLKVFTESFIYSLCWSSNAIEGNTLSLDETIDLIKYDEVSAGHSYSEYKDAKRLYHAIKKHISFEPTDITESTIMEMAFDITGSSRGYRSGEVYIGTEIEAVYFPPPAGKVKEKMSEFLADINDVSGKDIEAALERVCNKHIEFERIHPFSDGNGRTGRLIMNQMLINEGLLPICITPKSKYRQAFKVYDKSKDNTLMKYIMCNAEIATINEIIALKKKLELSREMDS